MSLVLIGMFHIRFGVVIRSASGMGTRGNSKRHAKIKNPERQLAHRW
jgi:hypothetical protein